jgi:membrane protease subunit (stomatin/prohibitin family)
MENLSKEELEFIVDSLNERWVEAIMNLTQKNLNKEKTQKFEFIKDKSMELMKKIKYEQTK